MPRKCKLCAPDVVEDVGDAMGAGESYRNIAKRFSVSIATVSRHKQHVALEVAEVQRQRELAGAESVADRIDELVREAWALMGKAKRAGSINEQARAIDAARRVVETADRLSPGRSENLTAVRRFLDLQVSGPHDDDEPDYGERVEDDADDAGPDDDEQTRRSDGA